MSKSNLKIPKNFNSEQANTYINLNNSIKYLCENTYTNNTVRTIIKDLIYFNVLDNYDVETVYKRILFIKSFGIGVKKDKLIAKYGEVEGTKKWQSYCNRQAETNTFEYKNKKYGMSEDEFKKYNKSRSVTLENLILRYGEVEGTKKWQSYCNRQAETNTLDYFIEKYGEVKGTEVYNRICKEKVITIENMIRVHGHIKGPEVYYNAIEKIKNNYVSKEEKEFIECLKDNLTENENNHSYSQFVKYCEDKKGVYIYDYVNTDLKIAVECNGSLWHGNPSIYNDTDLPLKGFNNSITAKEIWDADRKKMNHILELGVVDRVFVVWDTDDKDKKIKEIMEFVNEQRNSKNS